MLINLGAFLPILDLVLVIGLFIGGFFAIRTGFAGKTSEMQEKAIEAQNTQIDVLEKQIAACEKKVARLEGAFDSLAILLKRYALHIEINGETVTLIDEQSKRSQTVQIRIAGNEDKEA